MIVLGSKVKDKVTGFEGTAIARIEYLTGCIQYGVVPKVKKDTNEMKDANYIDEIRLEVIGDGINLKKKKTGGPGAIIKQNLR